MASRPDVTILVLTRGHLVRAEFAGGERTGFRRGTVNGERGMGALVAAAAGAGEPLRGPVWLLSDEVYAQALSLPAGAVAGLGEDETGLALGLEAQVLSGTPASQAVMGWRPLPGASGRDREFWIAQLPKSDVEQAAAAVRRLGGRLAGIVHPAGVPRRLSPDAPPAGRWRRIEFWHDVSAVVDDAGEAGLVARLGRGAPPRGRSEGVPAECLVAAPGPAALAQPAARALRLDEEDTLRAWLAAWGDVLATSPSEIPVVRVPEREFSTARRVAVGLGFATLVAAVCGVHAFIQLSRRNEARAELARLQEPIQRFEKTKAAVAALETKAKTLRAQVEIRPVGLAPGLPGRILEALASVCPAGVVVETLDVAWDTSSLRGLSSDPALVERFAGELSRELASMGRRAVPLAKKIRTEGPGAGFYEFEIRIQASAPIPAGRTP